MRYRLGLLLGAAVLGTAGAAHSHETAPAPGDWPRYARDLSATRFSPLDQINTKNVNRLAQAWSLRVAPNGGGAIVSSATPIVVDDVMYYPVGTAVVALEPETGKEIWRHAVSDGAARRAVSYWAGDASHPARSYYSIGKKIWALAARTGEVDPSFGDGGSTTLDVPYNYPPTIFDDVLVVGATTGEFTVGAPGDTRAFDAVTGKQLWTFHTVPRPGEVGHDTWLDDGWKGRSGTNVWIWYMSDDPKTASLFLPVGGTSPNYAGTTRPGTCSATASSRSISRPASSSGTSRRSTTICGTATCPRRRCCSTRRWAARPSPRSPKPVGPAICTSSPATPDSRCSGWTRSRSPRATCRANGIRRPSRFRGSPSHCP